jgi:hypothetical protein
MRGSFSRAAIYIAAERAQQSPARHFCASGRHFSPRKINMVDHHRADFFRCNPHYYAIAFCVN